MRKITQQELVQSLLDVDEPEGGSMIPKQIILHHSLTKDANTVSWQAIRRYHTDQNGEYKFLDIGYHYGIELINVDYEILVGRPMNVQGAHTKGHNDDSLGICVVGNYDVTELPIVAYEKLFQLVSSLMDLFRIPITNIKRHSDYAPKTCPGTKFPYQRLLNDLDSRTP